MNDCVFRRVRCWLLAGGEGGGELFDAREEGGVGIVDYQADERMGGGGGVGVLGGNP